MSTYDKKYFESLKQIINEELHLPDSTKLTDEQIANLQTKFTDRELMVISDGVYGIPYYYEIRYPTLRKTSKGRLIFIASVDNFNIELDPKLEYCRFYLIEEDIKEPVFDVEDSDFDDVLDIKFDAAYFPDEYYDIRPEERVMLKLIHYIHTSFFDGEYKYYNLYDYLLQHEENYLNYKRGEEKEFKDLVHKTVKDVIINAMCSVENLII